MKTEAQIVDVPEGGTVLVLTPELADYLRAAMETEDDYLQAKVRECEHTPGVALQISKKYLAHCLQLRHLLGERV